MKKRLLALAIISFGTIIFSITSVLANEDSVLVTCDDIVLTRSDFDAAISVVPIERRQRMSPTKQQAMIFLENVMVYRKLAEEARKIGLDKNPIVEKEVQQAIERVLGQHRLASLESSRNLPDFSSAAKERYVTKKADFMEPEGVRASHILILTEGRTEEEARLLAKKVNEKAVAGVDFTTLVQEYSEDPSKKQNSGDLGFFGRKQMAKPFEDAAFALTKPGEISPVVKSQFGYHIIKLIEKRTEQQKPFDEVKNGLIKELRDKFIADAKAVYISSIKNDKNIVIHEDAIEAMFKK